MEIRYSSEHEDQRKRWREIEKRHKKELRILIVAYIFISISLFCTFLQMY